MTRRQRQRQRLGQHFLESDRVAKAMADAACIGGSDTVFELGTGRGMLTRVLCKKAAHVTSVEADAGLAAESGRLLADLANLDVVHGDGLAMPAAHGPHSLAPRGAEGADAAGALHAARGGKAESAAGGRTGGHSILTSSCNVFASNLPYSRSRAAIEQLASSRFERCIIMVQKEFASKLLAQVPARGASCDRRAISVVAQYCFGMDAVMDVPASCFEPRPEVDSVVLLLARRNTLGRAHIGMINRMFSYRRKRLSSLLRMAGDRGQSCADCVASGGLRAGAGGMRVDDLGAGDVVRLAGCLLRLAES